MDTIGSTARDILQYGAIGLVFIIIVGGGFLALRGGRAIWQTVESFFTGLLAEFRRSNDNAIALHGRLDAGAERSAKEHEATRAALAREIHAAREQIEQTIVQRTSDVRDDISTELHRTGQHMAVTPPPPVEEPSHRARSTALPPRGPASSRG